MALIDMTNARIEVAPTATVIPATYGWVNLNTSSLLDENGNTIGSVSCSKSNLNNRESVYTYTATFSASGTEFYIAGKNTNAAWKISNISFQSGDVGQFDIDIKIHCN